MSPSVGLKKILLRLNGPSTEVKRHHSCLQKDLKKLNLFPNMQFRLKRGLKLICRKKNPAYRRH